ncbi:dbt-1, partial [Pristionchus pacificus]
AMLSLLRPLTNTCRAIHASAALRFPVVPFKLSDIGEGIAEVQVKEWHVKVGDRVAQFDQLCEVQSDKATVTISSRYDGVITKLHYSVDDVARVGKPLLDIEVEGEVEGAEPVKEEKKEAAAPAASAASEGSDEPVHAAGDGKVLATPAVRRVAIENNVDLSKVSATGRGGRVLKEDVLRHIGHISGASSSASSNVRSSPAVGAAAPAAARVFAPLSEDLVVPIRGYTRAMVKSMSEALKIPHFGYNDEFPVDGLVEVRKELKGLAKERGIKLSYMPFFVKAASLGLLEFPSLNATVDKELENVTQRASHNVCLAMDTPGGLVVPCIKHCEQRSVFEIAQELDRLTEAARRQQLSRDDLSGGTFTLSNIGAIGGTYASPVIFPPQVAIGAIGKMQLLPRYDKNGELRASHMVNVSWAADHRVVDGATMARFSNTMRSYLEHPAMMLAMLK